MDKGRLIKSIHIAFQKHFEGRPIQIKLRPRISEPGKPSLNCLIDQENIMIVELNGPRIEFKYSLRTETGFMNNQPMGPKENKLFFDAFEKVMVMVEKDLAIVEIKPKLIS